MNYQEAKEAKDKAAEAYFNALLEQFGGDEYLALTVPEREYNAKVRELGLKLDAAIQDMRNVLLDKGP